MGFSDEQIRDMLELKEDLTEKIIKYKEQIEKLEKIFLCWIQYLNNQVLQKHQILLAMPQKQ